MDESCTKMYINTKGKYHRLNGPAKEWLNGDKEGRLHREDGPAREYSDGDKEWYLFFKGLEEKDFNSWISRIQKCI